MLYIKALHIIFMVTWFAGLFYVVRLFIYNREAHDSPEPEQGILKKQFAIMIRRLWLGITWPSAILTLIFGSLLMWQAGWYKLLFEEAGRWLLVKLILVLLLYIYHFSLHYIYRQQLRGFFQYTSQQLRIWNEVATIFLVSIVMLATVRQGMSMVWGLAGLAGFIFILMSAIRIYKNIRGQN